MLEAVVFDLDGVLIESEQLWTAARQQVTASNGGTWREGATRAMMGMSSPEWSSYMHDELGVRLDPEAIAAAVVDRIVGLYRERLPLLEGARETVAAMGARWRLALASSANRRIIDLVLELAEMGAAFEVTVSAEEVPRGKPAPDVYLEAARELALPPARCAAVEDSGNGLRAASAAGMKVVAVPNRAFPPDAEALALADLVVESLASLRPDRLSDLSDRPGGRA